MDDHLFILKYYYLIFIIHFLLTSRFKIKIIQKWLQIFISNARSMGFRGSIDSLTPAAGEYISEPYDD